MAKAHLESFEEALKEGKFIEALENLKKVDGVKELTKAKVKSLNKHKLFSSDNIMDKVLEVYQKQRDDVALKTVELKYANERLKKAVGVEVTSEQTISAIQDRRKMAQLAAYNVLDKAKVAQGAVEDILKTLTKYGIHFKNEKHRTAYEAFVEADPNAMVEIRKEAVESLKLAEEGMKQTLVNTSTDPKVSDKEFKESLKVSLKAYRAGILPKDGKVKLKAMFEAAGVGKDLESRARVTKFAIFLNFVSKVTKMIPGLGSKGRSEDAIDKVISESKKYDFNALQTKLGDLDKEIATQALGKDFKGAKITLSKIMSEKEAVVKDMKHSLVMQETVLGSANSSVVFNRGLYNTAREAYDRFPGGKEELSRIVSVGKEVKKEVAAAVSSSMHPGGAPGGDEFRSEWVAGLDRLDRLDRSERKEQEEDSPLSSRAQSPNHFSMAPRDWDADFDEYDFGGASLRSNYPPTEASLKGLRGATRVNEGTRVSLVQNTPESISSKPSSARSASTTGSSDSARSSSRSPLPLPTVLSVAEAPVASSVAGAPIVPQGLISWVASNAVKLLGSIPGAGYLIGSKSLVEESKRQDDLPLPSPAAVGPVASPSPVALPEAKAPTASRGRKLEKSVSRSSRSSAASPARERKRSSSTESLSSTSQSSLYSTSPSPAALSVAEAPAASLKAVPTSAFLLKLDLPRDKDGEFNRLYKKFYDKYPAGDGSKAKITRNGLDTNEQGEFDALYNQRTAVRSMSSGVPHLPSPTVETGSSISTISGEESSPTPRPDTPRSASSEAMTGSSSPSTPLPTFIGRRKKPNLSITIPSSGPSRSALPLGVLSAISTSSGGSLTSERSDTPQLTPRSPVPSELSSVRSTSTTGSFDLDELSSHSPSLSRSSSTNYLNSASSEDGSDFSTSTPQLTPISPVPSGLSSPRSSSPVASLSRSSSTNSLNSASSEEDYDSDDYKESKLRENVDFPVSPKAKFKPPVVESSVADESDSDDYKDSKSLKEVDSFGSSKAIFKSPLAAPVTTTDLPKKGGTGGHSRH